MTGIALTDSFNGAATGNRASGFGIAALQLAFSPGDNIDQLIAEITSVAKRFPWVSMIVAGELCGYGANTEFAQCMPGDAESRLCRAAAEHNLWIIPGSLYELRDGAIFNTTPVIDPQGTVIARYRKIFPFRPYEHGIAPGNEFVVFDVPEVGRFGISICYDMWFPETIRAMVWQGAEVILHPTMTGTIDRGRELLIAQSNAVCNQCYLLDVNNAGDLGNGRSIFVGPEGEVLHQSGEQTEIVPLQLDLERVRAARRGGTLGLGQVLKSFRDTPLQYPCYNQAQPMSQTLADLGPMRMPERPVKSASTPTRRPAPR